MAGRPTTPPNPFAKIQSDMARGSVEANKFWDRYCVTAPRAAIVGFLTRIFALYAAATTPDDAFLMFEAVRKGVEGLRIMKQPNGRH